MTEQVVAYIDLPADEKKKRKSAQKNTDSMYVNRWLGVLPFALRLVLKRNK